MLRRRFAPAAGYEFKVDEVRVDSYTVLSKQHCVVYLLLETGLVADEGTMAEVFARDRRWFKIGKRGAVRTFDGERWGKNIFATW